jgi:hypothetical protein
MTGRDAGPHHHWWRLASVPAKTYSVERALVLQEGFPRYYLFIANRYHSYCLNSLCSEALLASCILFSESRLFNFSGGIARHGPENDSSWSLVPRQT